MTFRMDNTEGYTQAQLDILNKALEVLVEKHPDVDSRTFDDRLGNAWVEGISLDELIAAADLKS